MHVPRSIGTRLLARFSSPTPGSGAGPESEPEGQSATHVHSDASSSVVRALLESAAALPLVGRFVGGRPEAPARAPTQGLTRWTSALEPPITWATATPAARRSTQWPMHSWLTGVGSREINHWAIGGCLEKLDQLLGSEARKFQREERSRGLTDVVDLHLGRNGRWDTFNAGHCNQEAMVRAFFQPPERSVIRKIPDDALRRSRLFTLRELPGVPNVIQRSRAIAKTSQSALASLPWVGPSAQVVLPTLLEREAVELTPHDIEGLMVLCVDDLIDASIDNQGFSYVGFRYNGPAEPDAPYNPGNDLFEPFPHEVIETVCKVWGAKESRGIIVDIDRGIEVRNKLYDSGRVDHLPGPPTDFSPRETVPEGGSVKYYHIQLNARKDPDIDLHFDAWVHTADDGMITSGWIEPTEHSNRMTPRRATNADFFWIAHLKPEISAGAPWVGFADQTNPEVDMFAVWSLYTESIGGDWKQIAIQNPDRVEKHFRLAQERGRDVSRIAVELALFDAARSPRRASP